MCCCEWATCGGHSTVTQAVLNADGFPSHHDSTPVSVSHNDTPISHNDTPVSHDDTSVSHDTPVSHDDTPVSVSMTHQSASHDTPVSHSDTPVFHTTHLSCFTRWHTCLFHMTHLCFSQQRTCLCFTRWHTRLCSRPAVLAVWHRQGEGKKGAEPRRRRRSSCQSSRSVKCLTGSAATWRIGPAAGTGWTSSSTCRKQAGRPVTPADSLWSWVFYIGTQQSLWLSSVSAPSS